MRTGTFIIPALVKIFIPYCQFTFSGKVQTRKKQNWYVHYIPAQLKIFVLGDILHFQAKY